MIFYLIGMLNSTLLNYCTQAQTFDELFMRYTQKRVTINTRVDSKQFRSQLFLNKPVYQPYF